MAEGQKRGGFKKFSKWLRDGVGRKSGGSPGQLSWEGRLVIVSVLTCSPGHPHPWASLAEMVSALNGKLSELRDFRGFYPRSRGEPVCCLLRI